MNRSAGECPDNVWIDVDLKQKEVFMFSKVLSRSTFLVLGLVISLTLCIGLPGAMAVEEPELCNPEEEPYPCEPGEDSGCIYGCTDDADFTTEFRFQDCGGFKTIGVNPYFILKPGYRLELITPDGAEEPERSVETVLCDTK